MDTIYNLIADIHSNFWLSFFLYWLPLGFCSFGYIIRTYRNCLKDRKARETDTYYRPTDTIGTLIGRGIISILPVGNLLASIFDVAPEVFGKFFDWISEVFDMPLVPDSEFFRNKRKLSKEQPQ